MVLSPNWVARAHVCSWTGLAQAQMTPSKRMLLLDLASQRQNGLFHCRVDGLIRKEGESEVLIHKCRLG